jgi:hypothetical protein
MGKWRVILQNRLVKNEYLIRVIWLAVLSSGGGRSFRRLLSCSKWRDCVNRLLYLQCILQLLRGQHVLRYSVSTSGLPKKPRTNFSSCFLRMSYVAAVKHSARTFTNDLKLTFFLFAASPRNMRWLVDTSHSDEGSFLPVAGMDVISSLENLN